MSGICIGGICARGSCYDGVLNSGEGDVDWGGDSGFALDIAVGRAHTCVPVRPTGAMFRRQLHGQLGMGDLRQRGTAPTDMGDELPYVKTFEDRLVSMIAARENYSCALLAGGAVQCWGHSAAFRRSATSVDEFV